MGDLGNVYADLGEIHKAAECYEHYYRIMRTLQDPRGEGIALADLCHIQILLGDIVQALNLGKEALVRAKSLEDPRLEGFISLPYRKDVLKNKRVRTNVPIG